METKIFRSSSEANYVVSGVILPKFEHIQSFMCILIICKNEEDTIENVNARVTTTFSHLKSIWIFCLTLKGS